MKRNKTISKIALVIFFLAIESIAYCQDAKKPKLIVGVVIDQMRAEYLYRFQDNYSENGFKRLMREGFNVKNMHYNYVPTATGPGHASIYTGTTPADHGIVANDWYDRKRKGTIYCVEDNDVYLVDVDGSQNSRSAFSRSPRNLLSNTFTDELKLFSNGRSKVIGISLKDRGAILSAGHLADGAYWYNPSIGNFVTSTYYRNRLPDWTVTFNKRKVADSLLNQEWSFLLPKESYVNSAVDGQDFEKRFIGKNNNAFPFGLKQLRAKNGNFAMISETPFGNTLLTELAKATVKGEKMGKGNEIDFLALSYSSTDYIGHAFGIRSKEVEDTYIRMDREISNLLSFLDTEVGRGNYLLFLTADHAASDHPRFLKASRLNGRFFDTNAIKDTLNTKLSARFGKGEYISHIDKTQIYLNRTQTKSKAVLMAMDTILRNVDGIKEIYIPSIHASRNFGIDSFFRKSHHREISGDILLHFELGWMPFRAAGTTHGSAYNDDTHVPLLWYGWNLKSGSSIKKQTITQIVPTLSLLLDIPLPNASNNQPIMDLFD